MTRQHCDRLYPLTDNSTAFQWAWRSRVSHLHAGPFSGRHFQQVGLPDDGRVGRGGQHSLRIHGGAGDALLGRVPGLSWRRCDVSDAGPACMTSAP